MAQAAHRCDAGSPRGYQVPPLLSGPGAYQAPGTKTDSLVKFLTKEFDSINRELAERLVDEMRSGVSPDTPPQQLTSQQIVRLHELLHAARFADPKGTHLSPAGEYNLRLGVMKEMKPDLIATYQGDVRVFEGHSFIVEAAVSIGGRD
ncbi:DNA topoisomerase 6 subunit B, partial [Haematococcus lacustris]